MVIARIHPQFQSTPSSRRATGEWLQVNEAIGISIHALLTEGDQKSGLSVVGWFLFQSTPSSRRATPPGGFGGQLAQNFNPRPPHGGRHKWIHRTDPFLKFQSTPSSRRATV